MKIRNLMKAAAVGVATSLLITGCGASEETSSTTADGVVELNFHTWLPTQVQWPEIIEAFEEENPDIKINYTREEDYDKFRTNLDNEILAGELPDIYGIQVGASFDDYAEFAKPVDEYGAEWIDNVSDVAREETKTEDGTEAAVPILNAGMQYYLYNKTLMDEIGLELPTSFDELVDVSSKANENGLSPFAFGASDTWHVADFFVWLSNQYGNGDDIYKAAKGEIPWDSESLVAAATDWQKLFADGVFQKGAVTTNTYPQARDDYFLARKAIAMPTGSWHVGMALVGPDKEQPGSAIENDEVGMAEFPQIGPNKGTATTGVDFALALSNDLEGDKLDAAAKFAEFMAVGEGQQIWVNTLQGFPVASDISVQIDPEEPELAKSSLKLVEDSLSEAKYARKLSVPGKESLQEDLGVVLQEIADGADPTDSLKKLN
ncbi:ABC transporter substrate-binding protein [Corynebacterium glucuronolyticum]